MLPDSIPTEYIVVASATISLLIFFQSRMNGMESEWDREERVNGRLAGNTFVKDSMKITIDNIRIEENSGILYRIYKFLTNGFCGDSSVLVKYENNEFPAEFWDSADGQSFIDNYPVNVEHKGTNDDVDPTIARFKIHGAETTLISRFFSNLIRVESKMNQ